MAYVKSREYRVQMVIVTQSGVRLTRTVSVTALTRGEASQRAIRGAVAPSSTIESVAVS